MKKISFVIPCYNSERTIESVVKEIENTIKKVDQYEIILVNDCSKDNVWNKIKKLTEKNKNIKAVNFSKNFGQHSALMAGYRFSTGDIVVSVDDDGQIPIDEVYSLIDKLDEGYDVVYASYAKKKHSFFRNLGTKANNYMCEKMLGKPKEIMITSFFAAKSYIIDEMIKYYNPYAYVPGLVLRSTNNIASVPVNHREREIGESGYNFKKLLSLWINGFTAFSIIPLRASMLAGVLFSFVGFIYMIYIIIKKFMVPSVPVGYSSMLSIILLMGGIILLVLGMIGEYIGRIYININNSPQYIIKEKININKDEDRYEKNK